LTDKTKQAKEKAAETSLEKRIEGVIRDVLNVKLKALELSMDKKIESILKTKEIEMEAALRKGFGLETDPVVHQSDLIKAIRKATLDNTESQKRTPPAAEKAGPDGTESKNPFEEQLKPFVGEP